MDIPWWVYFFFGFVLGAITFSKTIRSAVADKMMQRKRYKRRYYDVEGDEHIDYYHDYTRQIHKDERDNY